MSSLKMMLDEERVCAACEKMRRKEEAGTAGMGSAAGAATCSESSARLPFASTTTPSTFRAWTLMETRVERTDVSPVEASTTCGDRAGIERVSSGERAGNERGIERRPSP